MAFYKSYFVPAPNGGLICKETSLKDTVDNIPEKGSIVKIEYAGVCHSDIHYYEGGYPLSQSETFEFAKRPGYGYPKVPGHEVSGVVYALGRSVPPKCGIQIGDQVCVFAWMGCGKCVACDNDETAHCTGSGKDLGMSIDGGYAQYLVVPDYNNLVPFPSYLSMELGCTLSCGCLTAYNSCKTAIDNVSDVILKRSSLKVAVIGLGGVGQWAMKLLPMLFQQQSTFTVTGIDLDEIRLRSFVEAGDLNDMFVMQKTKPVEVLVEDMLAHAGTPFNVVMDFVNNPLSFKFGTRILGKWGVLVSVGLYGGSGEVCLPVLALKTQKIIGIHTGSLKEFKELVTILKDLKNPIKGPAITVYQLDDCMKALNDLKEGKISGRAVLKCQQD